MKYIPWILFLLSLGYAVWLRFRVSSFVSRYYQKASADVVEYLAWIEKEVQKLKKF